MEGIAQSHPDATVEVWAEDEARMGLIPLARRVWSPIGKRPTMSLRRRYQWYYVFGFVHPASGRTEWLVTTTVSGAGMSAALQDFAIQVGAGAHRRIVLVLDGAGWHRTNKLVVPEGIHLVLQPPYSPSLQPAEKLWPLLHEAVANREFRDLTELKDVVSARCKELSADQTRVMRHTLFHWWPQDRQPMGR